MAEKVRTVSVHLTLHLGTYIFSPEKANDPERFPFWVLSWLMDSAGLLEYSLARRLELETAEG